MSRPLYSLFGARFQSGKRVLSSSGGHRVIQPQMGSAGISAFLLHSYPPLPNSRETFHPEESPKFYTRLPLSSII